MVFGNSTFSFAGGAASDILNGMMTQRSLGIKAHGDRAEAQNFRMAAELARENEKFTEASTAIKETQTQREIYLGLGETRADVAGAGFDMSGSGLDILRMGASQGALTKQVIGAQGRITEAGYDEQAKAYTSMADAADWAANEEDSLGSFAKTAGYITGALKGGAALATFFV